MFLGNTTVNIDEKGRIAVPAKYRNEVNSLSEGNLVVSVALNENFGGETGYLWMYPQKSWFEYVGGQLQTLPEFKKDAQKLRRFLAGLAYPCEMDGQGRVLLPEKLRKLTGLDKKAVLVGQLSRFEIWNEGAWMAQEAEFMSVSDGEPSEILKGISFL